MPKDMPIDARLTVVEGKPVELPSGQFISEAQLTREGLDLHMTSPDGHTIVVEGYFAQATPPDLITPEGGRLSPQLVDSFLPPERAGQYASSGQIANDASPAGQISEVVGDATIVRADGTRITATPGTPVYQGDVVETSKTGAVNITFADNTTFAISESARLSVDQFVYNSADHSGSTFFSMLQGVFVYTSGLIGKEDPGSVNIETPVGSIGIRGTVVAGTIAPAGEESKITILDGAVTLTNGTGTQVLNNSFDTVALNGYQSVPTSVHMDAQTFNATYHSVSNVAGDTFSHFSGAAAGTAPASQSDAPAGDAPATDGQQNTAPPAGAMPPAGEGPAAPPVGAAPPAGAVPPGAVPPGAMPPAGAIPPAGMAPVPGADGTMMAPPAPGSAAAMGGYMPGTDGTMMAPPPAPGSAAAMGGYMPPAGTAAMGGYMPGSAMMGGYMPGSAMMGGYMPGMPAMGGYMPGMPATGAFGVPPAAGFAPPPGDAGAYGTGTYGTGAYTGTYGTNPYGTATDGYMPPPPPPPPGTYTAPDGTTYTNSPPPTFIVDFIHRNFDSPTMIGIGAGIPEFSRAGTIVGHLAPNNFVGPITYMAVLNGANTPHVVVPDASPSGAGVTQANANYASAFTVNANGDLVVNDPLLLSHWANPAGLNIDITATDSAGHTFVRQVHLEIRDFDGLAASDLQPRMTTTASLSGSAGDDYLVAMPGINQSINGGGGQDIIIGNDSNNIITVSGINFKFVDGRGGSDTLVLSGPAFTLDLLASAQSPPAKDIEFLKFNQAGGQQGVISLGVEDVFQMAGPSHHLTIGADGPTTLSRVFVDTINSPTVNIGPAFALQSNNAGVVTYTGNYNGETVTLVINNAVTGVANGGQVQVSEV